MLPMILLYCFHESGFYQNLHTAPPVTPIKAELFHVSLREYKSPIGIRPPVCIRMIIEHGPALF